MEKRSQSKVENSVYVEIKATEQLRCYNSDTYATTKSNYDYWVKYYQASLQMLLPKMA